MMFDNSIKSILNGLIPADINDVLQEVYTILSNMLLEGDIKNLEEATKNEEIQARNSITVITTTR